MCRRRHSRARARRRPRRRIPPPRRTNRWARRSRPASLPSLDEVARGVPVIGFGAIGTGGAHARRLRPRQQRHAVPDAVQPAVRAHAALRAVLPRARLRAVGAVGAGLAGRAVRPSDPNPPSGARGGAAPHGAANVADLRAFVRGGLGLHGSEPRRHRRPLRSGPRSRASGCARTGRITWSRRLVAVDGPNHGIINCSPSPQNYYAAPAAGGSTPTAPCAGRGVRRTPLMAALNTGDETPGPTSTLTLVNTDTSFVYFDQAGGPFRRSPPEDREGQPHDFSRSADWRATVNVGLTGQGSYGARRHGPSRDQQLARELGHHVRRVDRPAATPAPVRGRRRPPCLHASASRRASPRRSCGRDRAGT